MVCSPRYCKLEKVGGAQRNKWDNSMQFIAATCLLQFKGRLAILEYKNMILLLFDGIRHDIYSISEEFWYSFGNISEAFWEHSLRILD